MAYTRSTSSSSKTRSTRSSSGTRSTSATRSSSSTRSSSKSSGYLSNSTKPVIIVESPGKCASIKKYADFKYDVVATVGHIKDLVPSKLGYTEDANGYIDFDSMEFAPMNGKTTVIKNLKAVTKGKDVFIATDADREGESIAYDVYNEIRRGAKSIKRVKFMEITKKGVQDGLANPSDISIPTVDAQRTRRLIDRMVGYRLTPAAAKSLGAREWNKVTVGRTQSAALKMVYDRDEEIRNFKPTPYWNVKYTDEKGTVFSSRNFGKESEARELAHALENGAVVSELKSEKRSETPPAPFEAGSLQSTAAAKLKFSPKHTMALAQDLYQKGHITYMRSDSVSLAPETIDAAREFLEENMKNVLPEHAVTHRNKGSVQGAHEAIHPTHFGIDAKPENTGLTDDSLALYTLIYNYFYASQCKPAVWDTQKVEIKGRGNGEVLKAEKKTLTEAGWHTFIPTSEMKSAKNFSGYKKDAVLKGRAAVNRDETKPPAHYSEASFIDALKKNGIGRPSTYVAIYETITKRGYVNLEGNKIKHTDAGSNILGFLKKACPEIIDIQFTKRMEDMLDEVENKKVRKEDVAFGMNKIVRRAVEHPDGVIEQKQKITSDFSMER